jgi:hypothetical protein
VEEDFLFVKYYGVGVVLGFGKVIIKPESGNANYMPPVPVPSFFQDIKLN